MSSSPDSNESVIHVRGARENNLKGVDCILPRGKLVAVTGPSGSGKSSLTFATIHKEAERRFLGTMFAPVHRSGRTFAPAKVDAIEGLSFSVAVGGQIPTRSLDTVATFTEVYDYLRLFYFHLGTPCCEHCASPLHAHKRKEMLDTICSLPLDSKIRVMAPLGAHPVEQLPAVGEKLLSDGYTRMRVDGEELRIDSGVFAEDIARFEDASEASRRYECEAVIDAFTLKKNSEVRLMEALELSLSLGEGWALVEAVRPADTAGSTEVEQLLFSEVLKCGECGLVQEPIQPGEYSYYRTSGCCEVCGGVGYISEFVEEYLLNRSDGSLEESIIPWREARLRPRREELQEFLQQTGMKLDERMSGLNQEQIEQLLFGPSGERGFFSLGSRVRQEEVPYPFSQYGVCGVLREAYFRTRSKRMRELVEGLTLRSVCGVCQGTRLKAKARNRRLQGNMEML